MVPCLSLWLLVPVDLWGAVRAVTAPILCMRLPLHGLALWGCHVQGALSSSLLEKVLKTERFPIPAGPGAAALLFPAPAQSISAPSFGCAYPEEYFFFCLSEPVYHSCSILVTIQMF